MACADHQDENGKLLFQTIRYSPKDFRQRRPDGKGGWLWKIENTQIVPYRLHEILKESVVFIVEGEKDAENLWKISIPTTTNPMGAGKWQAEWAKYFKGKEVFILPDFDQPGQKHAFDVAEKLLGSALRIKIVKLPGTGKDVSDWLANGGTKIELLKLVSDAKEYKPQESEPVKKTVKSQADKNFAIEKYCKEALSNACLKISLAPQGERNIATNKESFGIGQLVGAGGVTRIEAETALVEAGVLCGLSRKETEKSVQSGLIDGEKEPRNLSNIKESFPMPQPGVDPRKIYNPNRTTDMGNSERLFELAGNDIKFVRNIGWHIWKSGQWLSDEMEVREIFKKKLFPSCIKRFQKKRLPMIRLQ